jgi:hypothetical protein
LIKSGLAQAASHKELATDFQMAETRIPKKKTKRPRVRLGANGSYMSTKDPRKLYPQPPYSGKEQTPPGNEEEMSPKANHGESSYEGTGRLEGRRALVTGADSGIGPRPISLFNPPVLLIIGGSTIKLVKIGKTYKNTERRMVRFNIAQPSPPFFGTFWKNGGTTMCQQVTAFEKSLSFAFLA